MQSSCNTPPRVLIADDQADLVHALELLLNAEGFAPETASGPDGVLRAISEREFDVLLMDLNYTRDTTSGREGLDLLPRLHAIDGDLPVVVMTGWPTIDIAVEAMRENVRDFVQKPWDNRTLVATLRREAEATRERRRIARLRALELDDARVTQRRWLPPTLPTLDGWEIATAWHPARNVAGDCFDAVSFADGTVGLSVADAIGKGIPAALLMTSLQASVKALLAAPRTPGELCARINRLLYGHMLDGKFISFVYCHLDPAAGSLAYANAGHNAPVLVRADGSVIRLSNGGTLLGLFEDSRYDTTSVALREGDRVVMFTDGITEARDEAGAEFGEARLVDTIVANRHLDALRLKDLISETVSCFCGGTFDDDATLVVVGTT